MYKAIAYFEDLQDNSHPYNVGDVYPREGLEVTDERIKELASEDNLRGEKLIRKVRQRKKD